LTTIATNTTSLAAAAGEAEYLDMSIGAEVADVIELTGQVKDLNGTPVLAARTYLIVGHEATMIKALAAALTLTATTGTAIAGDADAEILVTTDANGVVVLDCEDTGVASGKTFIVKATPVDKVGKVTTLDDLIFDGP